MTEPELNQLLSTITPPDEAARAAAHAHWASLAKPLGGLGALETLLEEAAALTGTAQLDLSRRAVLVLCADNGVVAQGVSQTDQSVTRAVAENLAARRTSVCQMAKTARCEVVPVDMGMAGDSVPGVVNCRIAAGTQDFTQGPAMTRAEAIDAIAAGIALVRAQKAQGVQLLATGEMGIGNTTTSSAVAAVLLGQPIETMTGRGAGLSDEGLARKMDAIRRGIAVNTPDAADPLDVLAKLGGFDLAGLCGVFLGGALEGIPVLMDGWRRCVRGGCARRRKRPCLQATVPPSLPPALCWKHWAKRPSSRRGCIWARAPARWHPSRCGIWRWPCTADATPLRRAALRRILPNADAGAGRRGQRKKRIRRIAGAENSSSPLLPRHHAGVGRRVCRAGGEAPPNASQKAV